MATISDITLEDIINKTRKMLGENYREQETEPETENETSQVDMSDLTDICSMVIREAAEWTNRIADDKIQDVMNDCWPVIVKCSCMAYLNRGAEGLNSQSELGQQNVYNDWVTLMHKQITNRRHIL